MTVVSVKRKTLGIHHQVWIFRCPTCRTKSEVRDPHTAVILARFHHCKEPA